MRNKKLLQLQGEDERASKALHAYLNHLNARETDPSYVHARMLYEEGWRYRTFDQQTSEEPGYVASYVLWYDANEDSPPEYVNALAEKLSMAVQKELGLAGDDPEVIESDPAPSIGNIIDYLVELTEEVGESVPKAITDKIEGFTNE